MPSTKWSTALVVTLITLVTLELTAAFAIVSAMFNWHLLTFFCL